MRFISAMTLQALSGHPARSELFSLSEESAISHIELADWAEVGIIAPATAGFLARMAQGMADDLLATVCLATRAPLLVAPAMNVNMYRHAATQANLDTLAKRGVRIVGPDEGELACGWEGKGRLVAVEELAFQAPLKLYRDEPRSAIVRLMPLWSRQGNLMLASMETTRELAGGRLQATRHFQAKVRLDRHQQEIRREPLHEQDSPAIHRGAIYQAYFHGPSFQVLDRVIPASDGSAAGWMRAGTEVPPLGKPGALLARPMFTELAFQAAGILEARTSRALGLPAGVNRMKFHQVPKDSSGQVAAWVASSKDNGRSQYHIQVVDDRGYLLVELDGYRTSPLPTSLSEEVRNSLNPGSKA